MTTATNYLDALTPGIADRREADRARRDELDRISRELVGPAQEAFAALCYTTKTTAGVPRKLPTVSTTEYDAAVAAVVEAKAAYAAQLAKVHAGNPEPLTKPDPALVVKAAATEALRQHEIAVAAWQTASDAFAARDAAWQKAARPGTAWSARHDLGALSEFGGGVRTIENITRARVDGFDVRATRLVAEGKAVPTAPARVRVGADGGDRQDLAYNAGPQW